MPLLQGQRESDLPMLTELFKTEQKEKPDCPTPHAVVCFLHPAVSGHIK